MTDRSRPNFASMLLVQKSLLCELSHGIPNSDPIAIG
jgi:hypothetical protein